MSVLFETTIAFQRYVINSCIDFKLACSAYNVNLKETKSGVCFCPFHYNKNTPSAKVYQDGLYCFSENKYYKTSDLFDYFLVKDTIQNAFNNIWNILNNNQKAELKSKYEYNITNNNIRDIKKEILPLYSYKLNKIDYQSYCSLLLNSLIEMKTTR